jgi:hypothetical protein
MKEMVALGNTCITKDLKKYVVSDVKKAKLLTSDDFKEIGNIALENRFLPLFGSFGRFCLPPIFLPGVAYF